MIDWSRSPERPPRAEAEALLGELARLIDAGGHEPFTCRPVVRPDRKDFPDPFAATADGVRLLLRRLCWHAELEFAVEVADLRRPRPAREGLTDSVIRLDRVGDGTARFEVHDIGDDDVAGIASHEVGRAYCAVVAASAHPFRVAATAEPDAEAAVRLGSVAAVYLGLGVLAANAAHDTRTWGRSDGQYSHHTQTRHTTAGGLPPPALSFLLAVQAVVRGEAMPALEQLHANQAADLAAWHYALAGQGEPLRRRLGIPSPKTWMRAPARPVVRFDDEKVDLDADRDERRLRRFNTGKRVYRVRHHRASPFGWLGLFGGTGAGAAIAAAAAVSIGSGAAVGAAVGLVAGVAAGRRTLHWLCSDPGCQALLTAHTATCPRCGGTVAAEIRSANDRLDMDDQLDRAAAAAERKTRDGHGRAR